MGEEEVQQGEEGDEDGQETDGEGWTCTRVEEVGKKNWRREMMNRYMKTMIGEGGVTSGLKTKVQVRQ